MPRYKIPVYDPKLNEYLYDKLSRLTYEQRKTLSSSELRLVSSEVEIRKFVTWGTLEKKLAICSKVGIQFSLLFYENVEDYKNLIEKVYKQYTMRRFRLDNIEEMRDRGVFVVTNKEFSLSLSMLAQNCHSDVYYLNKDFIKLRGMVNYATGSRNRNPLNQEYAKSEEAFSLISKLVFHAKMAENFMRTEGLEMVDAMILLLMYSKAKTYIQLDVIQRALEGAYSERVVALRTGELFIEGYIDKLPTQSRKPQYTITGKGINLVGRILLKIVNSTVNE